MLRVARLLLPLCFFTRSRVFYQQAGGLLKHFQCSHLSLLKLITWLALFTVIKLVGSCLALLLGDDLCLVKEEM